MDEAPQGQKSTCAPITVSVGWMPLPALLPAQDAFLVVFDDDTWVVLSDQRVLSYGARVETWSTVISMLVGVDEAVCVLREADNQPGVTAVLLQSGAWGILGETAFFSEREAVEQAQRLNEEEDDEETPPS